MILKNKDGYVILDTETTGLGKNDVILQIGLIDLNGKELMNTFILPTKRKRISKDATSIHGITIKSLQGAPSFIEIYPNLKRLIGKRQVLIYNAQYDERLLEQTAKQDGFKLKALNTDCIMGWYSAFVGDWNDYHNSFTWQKLPGGNHSAVGDCQASLKVIEKMASTELEIIPKRWWQFW